MISPTTPSSKATVSSDGWDVFRHRDEIQIVQRQVCGFRWTGEPAQLLEALRAVLTPDTYRLLQEDGRPIAELQGGHLWVTVTTPTTHIIIPREVVQRAIALLGEEAP